MPLYVVATQVFPDHSASFVAIRPISLLDMEGKYLHPREGKDHTQLQSSLLGVEDERDESRVTFCVLLSHSSGVTSCSGCAVCADYRVAIPHISDPCILNIEPS